MVRVKTTVNGAGYWIILENVIYLPKIIFNVFSKSQVRRHGYKITIDEDNHNFGIGTLELFHKASGEIRKPGQETLEGLFHAVLQVEDYDCAHGTRTSSENIWQRKLRHVADGRIEDSVHHVHRVSEREIHTTRACDDFKKTESLQVPRKPVAFEDKIAIKPLDRAYSDSVRPMEYRYIGNSKYFVMLSDDCSGYSLARFLAFKSEMSDTVVEMIQEIELLYNFRVKKPTCINCYNVKWLCVEGGGNTMDWRFKCG